MRVPSSSRSSSDWLTGWGSEYARNRPYAMADDAAAAPQPQKRKLVNINNNILYTRTTEGVLLISRCCFPGTRSTSGVVFFWSCTFWFPFAHSSHAVLSSSLCPPRLLCSRLNCLFFCLSLHWNAIFVEFIIGCVQNITTGQFCE